MANFQNNAITENGTRLRSHVDMGAVFTATKIVIGSGNMPTGKTARTMTDVVSPVKELPINKKERFPDGKVVFGGVYTNEDVTTEFYFRELALYAKAVYPDGTEVDEVLYSYGNAGGNAERMAAYSTSTVVERQMDIVTFIGSEAQVDLTIESGIFLTAEMLARIATPEMFGAAPAGYIEDNLGTLETEAKLEEALDGILSKMPTYSVRFVRAAFEDSWFWGSTRAERRVLIRVNKWDTAQCSCLITSGYSDLIVVKYKETTWRPIEYVNPEMKAGLEYRTTERIDGKVVYKKNVNGVIQYRLDGETTWKDYAAAVGAVAKTGDQTMTGSLAMRTLGVTDGYMNGSVSTDGATSRVQILARNPNTGKAGAILVGPNGIDFMDGDGYEHRVFHEGNAPAVVATAELV